MLVFSTVRNVKFLGRLLLNPRRCLPFRTRAYPVCGVSQCEIRCDAVCFCNLLTPLCVQATFTTLRPCRVCPVRWGLFRQPVVQVRLFCIFILFGTFLCFLIFCIIMSLLNCRGQARVRCVPSDIIPIPWPALFVKYAQRVIT